MTVAQDKSYRFEETRREGLRGVGVMRAGIPVLTMSELVSTVRENFVRSYRILDESDQW